MHSGEYLQLRLVFARLSSFLSKSTEFAGRIHAPEHLGCPFQALPARQVLRGRTIARTRCQAGRTITEKDLLQNGNSADHHPDALHHAPRSPFYTGGMDVMTAGMHYIILLAYAWSAVLRVSPCLPCDARRSGQGPDSRYFLHLHLPQEPAKDN